MHLKVVLFFLYSMLFSGCLSGCATNFTGSAHIEGGRAACDTKCKSEGLTCTGMVFMGEYSSACVCSVRGASNPEASAVSAAAGGAAGVAMQTRAQQQAAAAQ